MSDGRSQPPLSAQVVISPSFKSRPEEVLEIFRQAGFEVGPVWADNFPITAPRNRFEAYLGQSLPIDPGGIGLSPDSLPAPLKGKVQAIVFSRPLDFGPTGSF